MKKAAFRFASCLICATLVTALVGCGGVGDWTCSNLPGNYEIWRINSRSVILCLPDETYPTQAKTVVDAYVFEVAYNDAFIFAKRANVPEDLDTEIDTSTPDYYIVEIETGKRYGPFSEEAFYEQCQEFEAETVEWMDLQTLRKSS